MPKEGDVKIIGGVSYVFTEDISKIPAGGGLTDEEMIDREKAFELRSQDYRMMEEYKKTGQLKSLSAIPAEAKSVRDYIDERIQQQTPWERIGGGKENVDWAVKTLERMRPTMNGLLNGMTERPFNQAELRRLAATIDQNPEIFTDVARDKLSKIEHSIYPFSETVDKAKWVTTYLASKVPGLARVTMGKEGAVNLREELQREAKTFVGWSGDLAEKAGDAAWMYVKYVKALPALLGSARAGVGILKELPKVKKAIDYIESLGGMKWVGEHFPRTLQAVESAVETFATTFAVSSAYDSAEKWGEGQSFKEAWPSIRNNALLYSSVTTAFDLASSRDRANYVKDLRKGLVERAHSNYMRKVNRIEERIWEIRRTKPLGGGEQLSMMEAEQKALYEQMKGLNTSFQTELRTIDKTLGSLENEMARESSRFVYKENELERTKASQKVDEMIRSGVLSKEAGEIRVERAKPYEQIKEDKIKIPTTRTERAVEAVKEAAEKALHPKAQAGVAERPTATSKPVTSTQQATINKAYRLMREGNIEALKGLYDELGNAEGLKELRDIVAMTIVEKEKPAGERKIEQLSKPQAEKVFVVNTARDRARKFLEDYDWSLGPMTIRLASDEIGVSAQAVRDAAQELGITVRYSDVEGTDIVLATPNQVDKATGKLIQAAPAKPAGEGKEKPVDSSKRAEEVQKEIDDMKKMKEFGEKISKLSPPDELAEQHAENESIKKAFKDLYGDQEVREQLFESDPTVPKWVRELPRNNINGIDQQYFINTAYGLAKGDLTDTQAKRNMEALKKASQGDYSDWTFEAFKLKDGKIVSEEKGSSAYDELVKAGKDTDDISERGWMYRGKFYSSKDVMKVVEPELKPLEEQGYVFGSREYIELYEQMTKKPPEDTGGQPTYYHLAPEGRVENILKTGFDISKAGTGIGERRGMEARGISITANKGVIEAYLRDSSRVEFRGTGRVEKLGAVKVLPKVKNPLDLTKTEVTIKDMARTSDDILQIAADIAYDIENPGGVDTESSQKIRDVFQKYFPGKKLPGELPEGTREDPIPAKLKRELGTVKIKASEYPDEYLRKILKGRTPEDITNELKSKGYDSIIYEDELKIFDPKDIEVVGIEDVSKLQSSTKPSEPTFGSENKIFTEKDAKSAAERLKKKGKTLRGFLEEEKGSISFGGLDPQSIRDVIKIGGYYAEGIVKEIQRIGGDLNTAFQMWSQQMIAEFGEAITPQLDNIWKAAMKRINAGQKPPPAKKKLNLDSPNTYRTVQELDSARMLKSDVPPNLRAAAASIGIKPAKDAQLAEEEIAIKPVTDYQLEAIKLLKLRHKLSDEAIIELARYSTGVSDPSRMTEEEATTLIRNLNNYELLNPEFTDKILRNRAAVKDENLNEVTRESLRRSAGNEEGALRAEKLSRDMGGAPANEAVNDVKGRKADWNNLLNIVARRAGKAARKRGLAIKGLEGMTFTVVNPFVSARYALMDADAKLGTRMSDMYREISARAVGARLLDTQVVTEALERTGVSPGEVSSVESQVRLSNWLFNEEDGREEWAKKMTPQELKVAKELDAIYRTHGATAARLVRWNNWSLEAENAKREAVDIVARGHKLSKKALERLVKRVNAYKPPNAPDSALEEGLKAESEGRLIEWIQNQTWGTREYYYMTEAEMADLLNLRPSVRTRRKIHDTGFQPGDAPTPNLRETLTRESKSNVPKEGNVLRATLNHLDILWSYGLVQKDLNRLWENFIESNPTRQDVKNVRYIINEMLGIPEQSGSSAPLLVKARALDRLFWRSYFSLSVTRSLNFFIRNVAQPALALGQLNAIESAKTLKEFPWLGAIKSWADKNPQMREDFENLWASNVSQKHAVYRQQLLAHRTQAESVFAKGTQKTGWKGATARGLQRLGSMLDNLAVAAPFSDEASRLMVWFSAYRTAQRNLLQFQNGEISWNKLKRRLALDTFHPIQQLNFLAFLEDGNTRDFTNRYAEYVTENALFRYETQLRAIVEMSATGRVLTGLYTFPKGVAELLYYNGVQPLNEGMRTKNYRMAWDGLSTIVKVVLAAQAADFIVYKITGKHTYQFPGMLLYRPLQVGLSWLKDVADTVSTIDYRAEEEGWTSGDYADAILKEFGGKLEQLIPFCDTYINGYEASNDVYGVRAWSYIKKEVLDDYYDTNRFPNARRNEAEAIRHFIFGGNEKGEEWHERQERRRR